MIMNKWYSVSLLIVAGSLGAFILAVIMFSPQGVIVSSPRDMIMNIIMLCLGFILSMFFVEDNKPISEVNKT